NKSLELDARRPEAHICLGRIHFGIGQYERAVADFSEAIKIDPRSTLAYRGRAWAFQRINKESEAEKDFLQASQLDPHDWHVYTSLAQLYLTQGRYDEAIRLYQSDGFVVPALRKKKL